MPVGTGSLHGTAAKSCRDLLMRKILAANQRDPRAGI